MHPQGSTCPPPPPPSCAAASHLLRQFERLLVRYNSLIKDWDINQPSVRAILEQKKYITRQDMQELVDRAEALVRTLGANPFINPSTDRDLREEYDRLERLRETTEKELATVGEELDKLGAAIQQNQRPARPIAQPGRFAPSEEVLQLREENTILRDENSRLGEDLEEARDYIRTLEEKLGRRR